ncbi:MAG: 2-oxoacid:acceptor oxidoreductase family protein [Nitrospirota bacterium]
MPPFTAWLPARRDHESDLVLTLAGEGVVGLKEGLSALERALIAEGFDVMAQKGRADGQGRRSTVRLRVSTEPVTSMGTGCDVLVCLDEGVSQLAPFGLARGSVLVCEQTSLAKLSPAAKEAGVVTYPVPFTDLGRQVGKNFSGKGLVAVGAVARLLGIPRDTVRNWVTMEFRRRYVDAGFRYAEEHLPKRDVFALEPPQAALPRVILDAHQAVLLGLGVSECGCGPACLSGRERSPDEWVAAHVSEARQLVSSLKNRRFPGVTVYRGPEAKMMVMVGADPTEALADEDTGRNQVVLVAADLADAVRLMGIAQRLVRDQDMEVWVAVDETLAGRTQSVPVHTLEQMASHPPPARREGMPAGTAGWPLSVEQDGGPGAEVGYVTWGAAQGVVREAVALCRSFGLAVSALYPKVLNPAPVDDIRSFAASVGRLVVVEPGRSGCYTNWVEAQTGLTTATIEPEPGAALTPMDLFMREGLGA